MGLEKTNLKQSELDGSGNTTNSDFILESYYNSSKTLKLSGLKTLQVDHQSF